MSSVYLPQLLKDKKLAGVISQGQPLQLVRRQNICLRLCSSIMSQQLSTKVAAVIFERFLQLFGGEVPSAAQILAMPFDTLRAIGLSNAKTQYVLNVARFATDRGMEEETLSAMGNEEVIEYLTQIKGVGRWTVEMLLMFTLAREDVFAADDLGIQQAMIRLYKLDGTDKKKLRENMLRISRKWQPYRTYACMHLWQWKDTPVVK